jgi:hypothetical protein
MPTKKGLTKYYSPQEIESFWEMYKQSLPDEVVQVTHPKLGVTNLSVKPPITWEGFNVWLYNNTNLASFNHYKKNIDGQYDEYLPICSRIADEIKGHNFIGAAVGRYKENIIARYLGMMDTQKNVIEAEVKSFKWHQEGEEKE